MAPYTPTPEEAEVLRIIQSEKTSWEDGLVWVTDKVQYIMRNVIKKARKNYFGVFNQPKDPVTGRDKIFIPLTEWTIGNVIKNIDIDTKDIEIKARNQKAHFKAQVFRQILHKKLNDINFGETLNDWLFKISLDGSSYLKAYKKEGRLAVDIVDSLNVVADPSVEESDDSTAILERAVLNKYEFDQLGLDNSEFVEGCKTIDKVATDIVSTGATTSEIPYVEVHTRYGYLPLFVKTGKEEDKKKYFYAKTIVSGLNGTPVVHSVEEAKDHPFALGRLKKVPNRLHGRGIAEMLFNIQAYVNEVVNYRMNKARIVQLGLFKMKGNITPQQFKRLFITGGIKLDASSDIETLDTGVIDPSSYKDEEQAYTWGNRVTGTTNEDEVAGNRPATNALIEERGTGKGYSLRIENIMLVLGEFIRDKMIPIIKEELKGKKGEVERITGDPDVLQKITQEFAQNAVNAQLQGMDPLELEQLAQIGMTPEMMAEQTTQSIQKQLGNERYVPIVDEIFDDYDVEVVLGDESFNKTVMAKMLQDTMGMLASAGLPITGTLKELYDTLGLNGEQLIQEMPQQMPQMSAPPTDTGAGSPAQQISQSAI